MNNATLNRFFALHFVLPFVLAALALMHLIALHDSAGSLLSGPTFLYIKSSFSNLQGCLAFIMPNFKANKRIGPHHNDIISFLVGSLLGDGHAERRLSGGVRFIFRQSAMRKEYIFWLYNFLHTRGYCTNNLPVYYTQITGDKLLGYYRFGSYSFSNLLWLYKLFYTHSKRKVIPGNIADLLTPLSLAIWICDDGSWKNPGMRFATNSFTKQEVILLSLALLTKFHLKSTLQINNGKHLLYIKKESIPLLREIVLPYMVPSMHYKLGL